MFSARLLGPGLLAFASALLLTGCTEPAQLDLTASPQGPTQRPEPTNAVRVRLVSVADKRTETASLGSVGGRPFASSDVLPWIEKSVLGRRSSFFLFISNEDRDPVAPTLKLNLLKAYVDNVRATKTAVVVIEAEFSREPSAAPVKQVFRGQVAEFNWASGKGEVQAALQNALDQCLSQVQQVLEQTLASSAAPSPSKHS